jgi:signal transduction histidine kinase
MDDLLLSSLTKKIEALLNKINELEKYKEKYKKLKEKFKKNDLILLEQMSPDYDQLSLFNSEFKSIEKSTQELLTINNILSQKHEELKRKAENKDKLFSIISHDIRSPFQSLLQFSKMLSEDIEHLSRDEIKEISTRINNSSNNIYNLVENLLQWARLQSNIIEVNPDFFNIYEMFMEVKQLYNHAASKKRIEIKLNFDRNCEIFADENMINVVARNIISNAIKFSYEGSQIEITAVRNPHCTKISISDNGTGISEDNLKKLFREDKIFSKEGTKKERGTGLGLLLCKEFIEQNGGKIWVESKINIGSKFNFTLPSLKS